MGTLVWKEGVLGGGRLWARTATQMKFLERSRCTGVECSCWQDAYLYIVLHACKISLKTVVSKPPEEGHFREKKSPFGERRSMERLGSFMPRKDAWPQGTGWWFTKFLVFANSMLSFPLRNLRWRCCWIWEHKAARALRKREPWDDHTETVRLNWTVAEREEKKHQILLHGGSLFYIETSVPYYLKHKTKWKQTHSVIKLIH